MKRKRFSVEQIVAAVKQHDLGVSATDIARKLGIAEQTFYRWKKQYGGPSATRILTLEVDCFSGDRSIYLSNNPYLLCLMEVHSII